MALTMTIPSDYGFVLLAAVSTFLVGSWHGMLVGGYRKAAKIPYPYEYASYEQVQTASPAKSKAMLAFNGAQRAHQNFNENHTSFLGGLLIAGLRYPVLSSVLGGVWAVNRVVYALGYTKSADTGGKGRYYGGAAILAQYFMVLLAGKSAWDIARA